MTATATSNDPNITEKAIQGLTFKTTTLLVYQTFLVHFFGVPLLYYAINITQCRGRGAPFLLYLPPPPFPASEKHHDFGPTLLSPIQFFKRFRKHCYLNASYVF